MQEHKTNLNRDHFTKTDLSVYTSRFLSANNVLRASKDRMVCVISLCLLRSFVNGFYQSHAHSHFELNKVSWI